MRSIFTRKTAIILFLAIILVQSVSGASLFFHPDIIETNPGDTPSVTLMMDGVGRGLSGYSLLLTIDEPSIASIVAIDYPDWTDLQSEQIINSTTRYLKAADSNRQIQPGRSEVVLADLILKANTAGYATISVTPVIIDDDQKGRYEPYARTGTIVISGAGPVPPIPLTPMNT